MHFDEIPERDAAYDWGTIGMKLGLSNEPRPPDRETEQTGRMPSLGNSNQQGNWLEWRHESA
jgi:hypothetical protein